MGVEPVDQRVWIFPEDRLRLFYNQSPTFEGAAAVPVTAGVTTENIDFSLPAAAIISGNVYQADGVTSFGVGVTIATEIGRLYRMRRSRDGSYRLWVPVGSTVKVKAGAGMCDMPGKVFPTQYWDHVTDPALATPITVGAQGQTTGGINFSSPYTSGTISGTVIATDTGLPLGDMGVRVDGTEIKACTNEEGVYTITGIPFNTPVKVRAGGDNWCGGATNYMDEWWDNQPENDDATPITLTGSEPIRTGIDFTLDPKGSISGTITDAGGQPIPNMGLIAHYDINHDVPLTCTDGDGHYTIYNVHVNIDVFVWAGGLNCDGSSNNYGRETWDNHPNWSNGGDPIFLTPLAPDRTGVDFVLTIKPLAPSGLTATTTSATLIDLAWTDNSSDETEFRIERSPNGVNNWTEIGTVGANGTSYQDTGLTPSTRYYYQVRAYRSGDAPYSDYSNIANVATLSIPPTLLAPADGTFTNDTTPVFSWNVLAGATLYRIQIDNNADFFSPAANATRTTPTYTASAGLSNNPYYWRVQARGADGLWSAWSEVWIVTVDTIKPAKPVLSLPASGS